MYEPVCRLKARVKTLLNGFFLSVSLWPFFAVTFLGHALFSLVRYSRISMSHFDVLLYLISKTFLVINEMIESDQKLLFIHEIATCKFFNIDAVGKNNKVKPAWPGEQGRNPGFAYVWQMATGLSW